MTRQVAHPKPYSWLMVTLLMGWTQIAGAAQRPNIIFIFADDQRADTIGAHGNPHIQTPHLDRLAGEGFSFRNNYCAGSYSGAVCVASRAMLMTGRHWMNVTRNRRANDWTGMPLLPEVLAQRGDYTTFITGKWHNQFTTLRRAFQSGRSIYMGGMINHASFSVQDLGRTGGLSDKRQAPGFSSQVFADTAIDYIKQAPQDNPFFLYVALTAPHDPRNPPQTYRDMYYNKRPPLPVNFLPQIPYYNGFGSGYGRDESLAPWPRPRAMISDQLCEYYGLITHLDEQIGRIMDALQGSPHAQNTYVVYTADHGLAMGSHGLLGKQNVYEQSMKSPLILRGPGIPAGKSSPAFSYIFDLYATLCGLAQVPVPAGVDAKDLAPIWRNESAAVRDSLLLPFQNCMRSVNDGRWKLHVYPQTNHRLLFDLHTDPHEMQNLAENPQHQGQVRRLTQLMQQWQKSLGDTQPLTVENPKPKTITFDNTRRSLDRWQPQWIRDKYFGGRNNPNHGTKQPNKGR
jgi:arylsulfatase A-like enzyme